MDFVVGRAAPLSKSDISEVAAKLGCDEAAVRAVCQVEAAGAGFLPDKRPKILFEAHVFSQLTGGIYDDEHPNISSPIWDRRLYGAAGAHQYDRLGVAYDLDADAAVQSASWGMFQIMGHNYPAAGFADVTHFVAAMCDSERAHLDAFSAFVSAGSGRMRQALVRHDWPAFARLYNGPGQVDAYAGKLGAAYDSADDGA